VQADRPPVFVLNGFVLLNGSSHSLVDHIIKPFDATPSFCLRSLTPQKQETAISERSGDFR